LSGPDIVLSWRSFKQLLNLVLVSAMQVRETIEKELGEPMSDLFADFVLDPLATASVSTVLAN
jgi:predicted unusual protein kinase regulating ubiquinone biosynthesis (AarF/ABC1/UbiB family)